MDVPLVLPANVNVMATVPADWLTAVPLWKCRPVRLREKKPALVMNGTAGDMLVMTGSVMHIVRHKHYMHAYINNIYKHMHMSSRRSGSGKTIS